MEREKTPVKKHIFYNIFFLTIIFQLTAIFIPMNRSYAADTTWTGAISTDWAIAGNWSLGTVPTSADNVTIPDASTTDNDPAISSGAICYDLTIAASGVLDGNANTISVYGNWINSGIFNHGNGAVVFRGGANKTFSPGDSVYYDIEASKTSGDWGSDHLSFSGIVDVLGNFIHTDGRLLGGQINLAGDYIIGANASGLYPNNASTIINLNHPSNDQNISSSGGIGAYVQVNKTGGSVSILDNISLGGWIYISGAVNNLDIYDLTFRGNSNGVFTPGNLAYNNIIVNYTNSDWGNDHLTVSGTADVFGNLIQTNGRMLGGQINLAGDYTVGSSSSGAYPYTSATIINLNHATNDQVISGSDGIGAHIYINKPGGSVSLTSDLGINDWTYIQGVVNNLDSYTLTFGGQGNGTFTHGGLVYGNIVINKTASEDWDNLFIDAGALNINNLTVTDGELYFNTNNPTVNISGNVTIAAAGNLYAGTSPITVNGNWTNEGIFNHGNGAVIFAGTDIATLASGVSSFYNLELNKTHDYGYYNDFVISGIVTVVNDLTHTDGEFRDGQINVAGDYIIATGSDGASSISVATIVNVNGGADQFILYSAGGIGDDIHVDKSSGTLMISSDIIINGWTYIQGTVMGLDNHTLIFGDNRLGYFMPGSLTYSDIEINKTSHTGIYDNVTVSGTVDLTGNLIHTEGEFNGGQFNFSSGNYIVTATADGSQSGSASTIMNFNGAGDQSVIYSEGGVAAHIRVDKPSGNLYVMDNMVVHDWTYVQGNIPDMDTYTLILGDGGQSYFTSASLTYGNIEIYKTEHNGVYDDLYITAGTILKINGSLYLREGQLRLDSNDPSINLGGDFTIGVTNAFLTRGTGTITFDGTTPSIYTDLSATAQNIGKIILNKTNTTESQNKL
ncbi:MAG: hypothetical protein PHI66_02575, partial [Candidatus Pacebacteria bacterium]|nr:hypothetical protein [Candidatus Paceibacterota bacterium]